MNIDFDKLKYSLTGEYEEVMLEKQLKEKDKEIERLNKIIEWQQNKIAKLNSENVCLKAKIELYEDGYILNKDSDKE